ncbi:MAG TPA: AAA family ATPase [Candidatus Sulfotelmatobacter sp.]|nr:AAA family ATPase [Candidatus Sulfotelmatobacter sp.]
MDELGARGELEAAGGIAYLSQLADGLPRVTNVEHYARIMTEKRARRDLIFAAENLRDEAFVGSESAAEILATALESLRRIGNGQAARAVSHTAAEVCTVASQAVEYIVWPLAPRGMVALLDGPPKTAGKTTLVLTAASAELSERIFLNRATKRARILLVSEEGPRPLSLALSRAELAGESELRIIHGFEFAGAPWPQIAAQIERECISHKIDWLVIDTFYDVAQLAGDDENKAGAVAAAVAPIRHIASKLDIPVTLTRHERKSGGEVGESGRGSSALTGAVDSVMLLRRIRGGFDETRSLEVTGRIEAGRFEIELRDGQYRIIEAGKRVETIEKEGTLDAAISANPKASVRELATALHIGRNRLRKLAEKLGWRLEDSGWVRPP